MKITIELCILELGTKIHFEPVILNFGNKFAQKGYFVSETKRVNITIEFCSV